MNKIQVGDKVVIHKPKDVNEFPSWTTTMDVYDGTVQTVSSIPEDAYAGRYIEIEDSDYIFSPLWCTKVVEPEEMTLDKWSEMTPQERLEWNRPAFEALTGGNVEWMDHDGKWYRTVVCDILMPHRPVKKVVKFQPPKEVWFVANEKGEFVTEECGSEQEANNWIETFWDKGGTCHMVKYVLAE